MTQREAIDFAKLVAELVESQTVPEQGWPVIVGGECESQELLGWLGKLKLEALDTRIWCYADMCEIGSNTLPQKDVALLERARLFGAGGDLDIWRTGKGFRWRYVGLAGNAPQGKVLPWPGDDNDPTFWREQTMLLWGNRPEGRNHWHDDRVAGAALSYPVKDTPERVQVRYREYTQAGRPFAVWFTGLEGCNA
jgi:hypothetical protein